MWQNYQLYGMTTWPFWRSEKKWYQQLTTINPSSDTHLTNEQPTENLIRKELKTEKHEHEKTFAVDNNCTKAVIKTWQSPQSKTFD